MTDERTFIKRMLPVTLFGRALLILMVPIVAVQLVTIYMFFERHWDSVVRNMSNALAGEIIVLVDAFQNTGPGTRLRYTQAIGKMMGIDVTFDTSPNTVFVEGEGRASYPDFFGDLSRRLNYPFMVRRVGPGQDILISILMKNGVLSLQMTKKRLVSPTTYIFVFWMTGSAVLVLIIATLFLRNQIRPIRQLAKAAEQFGLGHDAPNFRPCGASEVRQAGRAFITMRNRIQRQVSTRTEMLAGISHDLRTPLTRVKLQLAMMKMDDQARKNIKSDVEDMEHMIQEYLDFARGEGQEQSELVSLHPYLSNIADAYRHHDEPVVLQKSEDVDLRIRPKAMRRAIQNIIDNAVRYGERADITIEKDDEHIVIYVDDQGPGIPKEDMKNVFRPFTRLDPSRNVDTGGAGLGLSIARDVVVAHGGTVALANKESGLRVMIRLPRHREIET